MTNKEQALTRAITMSNKKPMVQTSKEVLEHIDPTTKVRVYYNLHKSCLSIQQYGLVKCHAQNIVLKNFQAIVNKKGQERVRREKSKNVHSYIEGFVIDPKETWKNKFGFHWSELYYNPYKTDFWTEKESGRFVDCGQYADIDGRSVLAYNYVYKS